MNNYFKDDFLKSTQDIYADEVMSDDVQENYMSEELLTYDNGELLEITEEGYDAEEFEGEEFTNSVVVASEKELQDVISRAEQENWKSLLVFARQNLKVPAEIGKLKNLRELGFEGRKEIVVELPSEIGELNRLEVFQAYHCNMKSLPKEFSKLENLRIINLNDNRFSVFPKELLQLQKLESLAINYNYKKLPDEICNLTNLKYLYLPHAKIEDLPKNIGNLKKLEVLCIWGTEIKRLPNSCLQLQNIKSLYLTKSLFKDTLPPEIAKQSPLEAIKYIISYQNDTKKIEVNESKMIIVGQGGVGKTCLLNRLIYDKYDETVTTEGIDIAPWEFECKNKRYKLNVWDFGGQEIYHATHQFFLTNRSLYIFVWDARQEEEYGRIDYWLHTIESFANDSPIIIVVNKCDSRNSIKQLDLKSIKEKFPQIIDSFKVSCKENVEIEHLRDVIREETTRLPLMGMVWLSSWLEVKLELEKLAQSKNIITYNEYENICGKNGVLSEDALSLSKYLHDLGIILNFQNDVYLKNIVILNPEWGTNAVYKVLDAQENILKDRNGILYYEDLSEIWKDSVEYPLEIYPVILRLMENFQLSFEVRKNEEYLIAELLESEEVAVDIDDSEKQILNFQYNYEFLPAGIMTRFIVKANSYLMEEKGKKACWKKGAYIKYGDSVGVIKLFDGIAERKIEIKVIGQDARDNRELLFIIRKYFDEIHKSVPKIKYTEYVKCNCNEQCPYLHDYRYLLKLEKNNIKEERCKESLKLVSILKLLDGVEDTKRHRSMEKEVMNQIHFQPNIVIENNNTNSSENSNINEVKNTITIQIKNCINELQGSINDLQEEVVCESPELKKEFEKLGNNVKKLNDVKTKDEIVASGVLNKVKRFLIEIQDSESELGKVIKGIKYGVDIAKEIGEKYNTLAEWCGFPVIPKIFLKK